MKRCEKENEMDELEEEKEDEKGEGEIWLMKHLEVKVVGVLRGKVID